MKLERCKSCGASIFFAASATTGRRMPIDASPEETGNLTIDPRDDGQMPVAVYTLGPTDLPRYVSHFTRCPQADRWRSKGARR